MTRIKSIAFDFDGVLLQSNAIKRDIYFQIFPKNHNIQETITDCLSMFPDVNRVELIHKIIERLGEPIALECNLQHEELVKQYAVVCEEQTTTCSEVNGTFETLTKLTRNFSLFVNSATLESSLQNVVSKREWSHFFQGVYGSPRSKVDNLQLIMKKAGIGPDSLLFVGDGNRDLTAAKAIGCFFVGVRNEFNDFEDHDHPMIEDMQNLFELVIQIV